MQEQPLVITQQIKLKDFDPSYAAGLDKDATKQTTEEIQERIGELQQLLYANSTHAILLLFQGMDASGKDGAVGSVLRCVNPVGVEVANFKVPSDEERAHDYLWRIHQAVPRYGRIGTFNRSHYEAVVTERVLGIVSKKICLQRYDQIIAWERMLAENHVVLLKFFLHLSREEQAERLQERLDNPRKQWKFSEGDLVVRKQWKTYADAYEDALNATSHPAARWHVVPADRNWYRDFVIAKTVVAAMESLNLKWPKHKLDLTKVRID
jgi:PPK2 family polyphosphate:nucleotide phosphotransferase